MFDRISTLLLAASLYLVEVRSAVHVVTVGNGGFTYSPNTTHAKVGDVVSFEFFPTNHSVYRAEYTDSPDCPRGYCNPCVPYQLYHPQDKDVFFSGLMVGNLDNPPTWNLTINSTEPIFFSCNAPGSCHPNGMVGVINPNKTVSLEKQYQAAVAAQYQLSPGQNFPSESAPTAPASPGTSSAPSNNGNNQHHSHGLSGGAIAGIVIGCVAGVAIIGVAIFFWARSRTYGKIFKDGSSAPGGSEAGGGVGAWVAGQQAQAEKKGDPEMGGPGVRGSYQTTVGPNSPRDPTSPNPADGSQFVGFNRQSGGPEYAHEVPGIDHQINELQTEKSRENERGPAPPEPDSPTGRVELP